MHLVARDRSAPLVLVPPEELQRQLEAREPLRLRRSCLDRPRFEVLEHARTSCEPRSAPGRDGEPVRGLSGHLEEQTAVLREPVSDDYAVNGRSRGQLRTIEEPARVRTDRLLRTVVATETHDLRL